MKAARRQRASELSKEQHLGHTRRSLASTSDPPPSLVYSCVSEALVRGTEARVPPS